MELLHDLEERQQPSSDQAKDEEKERLKVHPPGAFVSGRLWWKVEDISGKGENYIMGPTYISWKSLIWLGNYMKTIGIFRPHYGPEFHIFTWKFSNELLGPWLIPK